MEPEIQTKPEDELRGRAGQEIMALAVEGDIKPIIPRTYAEAFRMAQAIISAGLAPTSYEKDGPNPNKEIDPEKVTIGIMAGLELGVPPIQALSGIAIINKRPSVWGDLAVALVQREHKLAGTATEYTGMQGEDDYTCTVKLWRINQDGPYVGRFSIGDAKRARLWGNTKKTPWIDYPYRMLFNRARAFALRDGFADCLKGMAIAEEQMDMPQPLPPKPDASFLAVEQPRDEAAQRVHVEAEFEAKKAALPNIRELDVLEAIIEGVANYLKDERRPDLLAKWEEAGRDAVDKLKAEQKK